MASPYAAGVLAVVLPVGGLIGFLRKKSVPSLAMGSFSGFIMGYLLMLLLKDPYDQTANIAGAAVSLTLAIIMSIRALCVYMRRKCLFVVTAALRHGIRHNSTEENKHANDDSVDREDAKRLVQSLGFDMNHMEQVARSFLTGEKPSVCSSQGVSPKMGEPKQEESTKDYKEKLFRDLLDTCWKDSSLLPLLLQLCALDNSIFVYKPKTNDASIKNKCVENQNNGQTDDFKRLLLHSLRHFMKIVPFVEERDFSESEKRLGGAAVLALTLQRCFLHFRREGKRLFHGVPITEELNEWRKEVLEAHIEAFCAVQNACAATAKEIFDSTENALGVTCGIFAVTISSSVISSEDELQWHLTRPAVLKIWDTETISAMSERATQPALHLIKMTMSVLDKSKNDSAPSQRMQVFLLAIKAARGLLDAIESRRASSASNNKILINNDAALCMCTATWLLKIITALPEASSSSSSSVTPVSPPSVDIERDFISTLQRLWTCAAPPLERHVSDSTMTHRTMHSSLNIRYARVLDSNNKLNNFQNLYAAHPENAAALLQRLDTLVRMFATWHTSRGTIPPNMVTPYAVLCRTVMDMEVELYFLASRSIGREWVTIVKIGSSKVISATKIPSTPWRDVLSCATSLRVSVSRLTCAYFVSFVAHAIKEKETAICTDVPFVKRPFYRFFQSAASSIEPLLRRHYIDSGGLDVLEDSVAMFVALKQASDAFDGDGEERRRGERTVYRVCGVRLAMAMEVAFFLSLRPPSTVSHAVISAYVKEVLFALDHNTAKQLWHLRLGKQVRRCFTGDDDDDGGVDDVDGDKNDGIKTKDERRRLRRRQAQSVLSVVHAHVMHPSFLWMPLWQLQEVLLILARNRNLLEEPVGTCTDNNGKSFHALKDNSCTEMRTTLNEEQIPTPAVVRVGSLGGILWHFSRALGYVMLRLFVVTNIMRHYRRELSSRGDFTVGKILTRGASLQPTRRHRRQWAVTTAKVFSTAHSGLPAQVEGLSPNTLKQRKRGNQIVFDRLDATVDFARQNQLLFDVRRRRRAQRRIAASYTSKSNIDTQHSTSSESVQWQSEEKAENEKSSDKLILHVRRANNGVPLGFSLHANHGTLRRLTSTHATMANKKLETTPFIEALSAVGVKDANSVIGWRVTQVDGKDVDNGKAVIALVRGKKEFTLTLLPP